MTCKCCVSLRGLAYFGASSHVVVGFMHFTDFLESLFAINQLKLETENVHIGTERLVYHWVFLSLGLLIFQGVDRESKTLVKRSGIIFFILQALTVAVRLKNGHIYSTLFRGLAISILASGLYLMILFLYVRKLEGSLFYADSLFPSNTAHSPHIPLTTTNLGWFNHPQSSRGMRGATNNPATYSPLNFFGGFNPMVWSNPGPPPPYTDAAPPSETQLHRNQSSTRSHGMQPCSSRTASNGPTCRDNTDTKIHTASRTSQQERNEPGDDASVVPLLDENVDKNGLES